MENRIILIKRYDPIKYPHPSIELVGLGHTSTTYDTLKNLKSKADWAEGIIEHYESLIRNEYVRREDK